MRITDAMQARQLLEALRAIRQRSAQDASRLSSGRRIEKPSDDPAGAARALTLRTRIAVLQRYAANTVSARAVLSTADSALASVNNLLTQAATEALNGANEPQGSTGRQAIAVTIDSIRDQLLANARTTFSGRFVFSGTDTKTDPYDAAGNYQGNNGVIQVETGENPPTTINVTGTDVFGPGTGIFGVLEDLSTALRNDDTAGIQSALTAIQTARDDLGTVRADVGNRLARLDAATNRNDDARLELLGLLSGVEDADLAEVITRLAGESTAEQATLATLARLGGRSLFDYLG